MRDLRNRKKRVLEVLDKYENLYSFSNLEEYLVNSNGVLNFIWNNWNNWWRDYWLAHINGGYAINSTKLNKMFQYNDKQSLHYLCHLTGKFRRHNFGDSIIGTHQELTWGDYDRIEQIALELYSRHPHLTHLNYLLSLIGTYQTEIKHFQLIRNSFIHLNNESVNKLNSIKAYYVFGSDQKLIQILESNHINSNRKCINHLVDNMRGLIINI